MVGISLGAACKITDSGPVKSDMPEGHKTKKLTKKDGPTLGALTISEVILQTMNNVHQLREVSPAFQKGKF